jgi:molecular chaperone DnaJ
MAINHYQLLGIPEDADARRIKAAYRSMAKRFHPDANQGSEAAADLFRQINEAYRILCDEQLRKAYNRKIATEQHPTPESPSASKEQAPNSDPQQKFNRFLNSLLDAIFESPQTISEEKPVQRAAQDKKTVRKVRRKPDFNFYYFLAKERSANRYYCDTDGIYRRCGESKSSSKRGSFGRVPGSSFALLLVTSLWTYLRQ